ncbi:hypothetical protein FRC17_006237 [Serendipita sp. 399]|nr:hypothetical protein FRC17_006237 [Serendipita sp. 399]
MIGVDKGDSKFDNPYQYGSTAQPQAGASSSGPQLQRNEELALQPAQPPPPFESQRRNGGSVVIESMVEPDDNWVPFDGELPPEFTPYQAQHWVTGDGDVISHDPHLNEDGKFCINFAETDHVTSSCGYLGEALYRFLLQATTEPPKLILRCRGTHRETRTRVVTHSHTGNNGSTHHHGTHTKTETYTETVVDFDFQINVSQQHLLEPSNWTVADEEPAYRGKMVWEKDIQDGMSLERKSTRRKENKSYKKWTTFKKQSGLAPWVPMALRDPESEGVRYSGHGLLPLNTNLRSSRSVRNWADDYCGSHKVLKEFVFEKVVYGWNMAALEQSIITLIKSTYYSGDLSVTFQTTGNKVYIRPDNWLSRSLSHWWVKLLLWITLIYPFVWLFKRFATNGGGVWKVAGAAYPLKEWVHCEGSVPGEDVAQYMMKKEEEYARLQRDRALAALPSYTASDQLSSLPAQSSTGDAWSVQRPRTLAQFNLPSSPAHASSATQSLPSAPVISRLKQTPKGISELVGLREGEWFRMWEGTISKLVLLRTQRSDPIMLPSDVLAESAGAMLDGYHG